RGTGEMRMTEAASGTSGRGAGTGVRRWTVAGIGLCEIARAGLGPPCAGDAAGCTDERPYLLVLQQDGDAVVTNGGIEARLNAGDIAVIDGTAARWTEVSARCRQLRLHLPQAWLRSRLPPGRLPPLHVVAGSAGLGSLLAGLLLKSLQVLRDEPGGLDPPAQVAVRDAVVGLVAAALTVAQSGGPDGAGHLHASPPAARLWPSLCAWIEARLPEPGLCPADVAQAHGISTRHLHRLFHNAGTSFGTFVRNQRLARCRADLADPRCAGLAVTTIAFRWGFSDSAHFSRSFKAAYGTTARAFRSRTHHPPLAGAEGGWVIAVADATAASSYRR
ncbi:MAG TPA: helix-turn-helix domain-containing protein, partial [Rhodospirillales bacterium]|nr:helix-turn-helix domain-containing protein [Rhodospirillales bacterium]